MGWGWGRRSPLGAGGVALEGRVFAGTAECRIFVGDKQIQEIDEAKLNL